MEDSEEAITKKVMMAYCAENVIEENPCIDWFQYFVLGFYGEFE